MDVSPLDKRKNTGSALSLSSAVRLSAVLLRLFLNDHLFGFSQEPVTAADLLTNVTGKLACSLVALLTPHSSIFHDHDL